MAELSKALTQMKIATKILAEATASLANITANDRAPEWVDKHSASEILTCHPDTLLTYRKDGRLIEDVHWQRRGGNVVYCRPLLENMAKYWNDKATHNKAINEYYK